MDHGIGACKTYSPRQYPNDRESKLLVFRLENFTGKRHQWPDRGEKVNALILAFLPSV